MSSKKYGCEQCKDFWEFSKTKMPDAISINYDRCAELYKCQNCSSYWEESQRFAYILSDQELHEYYPKYCEKLNKGEK